MSPKTEIARKNVSTRINVTKSSLPPFEEYCAEIAPLWESRWLTNCGIKHNQLENALQEYLGVDCVSLFANGHSALECLLEALELGKDGRNEVITTPFTFASTVHAIVRKGLKPVFADIKPSDYTIDPTSVERLVNDKTCALLPVHVYGNLCDVDTIREIADLYDLKLIYDAAHAFGVSRRGISAACFGDASMLSFHATKVFNTIEGGAVCCSDPQLYERLKQWRNFGIVDEECVRYPGGNAKMNEFSAAMGLCNLRHVEDEIARRKNATEQYWRLLDGIPGLKFSGPAPGVVSNYAYMPIEIDPEVFGATRDEVAAALAAEEIYARRYFYPLASEFECYKNLTLENETPVARKVSKSVLVLPLFADLATNDIIRISRVIRRCANE